MNFDNDTDALKMKIKIAKNSFVPKNRYPDHLPEWYAKELKRLSEKYRPIRWLPLDIPRFEFEDYDKFLEVWDREAVPIVRVRPDVAEPWDKDSHPLKKESNWHNPAFKGLHAYVGEPEKFSDDTGGAWTQKYYPDPVFEPMVEHIKKYFPFHYIEAMFIWESVIPVGLHCDQTWFFEAPTEFRMMLHDDNSRPTLHVVDMDHYDKNYIDCPADTNSFCWSNGTQLHGSDYLGGRKQLLIINGIFSISKLEKIGRAHV
mgnify:CR=1 FL=1